MSGWAGRMGLLRPCSRPLRRITLQVTRSRRNPTLQVVADDTAATSRAGTALRDQADLFGRVASDATAWRVIDAVDEERLQAIRAARARARERAWAAGVLRRAGHRRQRW